MTAGTFLFVFGDNIRLKSRYCCPIVDFRQKSSRCYYIHFFKKKNRNSLVRNFDKIKISQNLVWNGYFRNFWNGNRIIHCMFPPVVQIISLIYQQVELISVWLKIKSVFGKVRTLGGGFLFPKTAECLVPWPAEGIVPINPCLSAATIVSQFSVCQ